MFYDLNEEQKARAKELLEHIKTKLEKLNGLKDIKSLNKAKHVKECVNSLQRCLDEKDEDKYDFFIWDIYTLVWGIKPFDEMSEEEKQEANLKVDKYQENIPSLKQIAQSTLKAEVDELIDKSFLMSLRLKEYDEKGVPRKISIRQAKLILLENELLDDIEEMIASSDKKTQISWEYATEFERNNPLILSFQKAANLSDEFVDELFKKAKEL
ncbi:hypothetical protein DMB92_08415 [Campylobacter sp. MIT 99-7217]|uniref:hypothetical protein n=1 Tax=Campylobacter sp. MIT 99-7217 TaxID=535091 RepID=UPI00115BED0B|nr:hypothetical protein [Campylobacter sp. MIT 99-7217]TQR29150.1 hypothetical protein DMB92_08415 [Campylobacter sp. MIT 99-7217]